MACSSPPACSSSRGYVYESGLCLVVGRTIQSMRVIEAPIKNNWSFMLARTQLALMYFALLDLLRAYYARVRASIYIYIYIWFRVQSRCPPPYGMVCWFSLNFIYFHRFSLILIDFHWFWLIFQLFSMIFIDFLWFLIDFDLFSLILIDFSMVFFDFHWFSLIFHWFWLIFIDFEVPRGRKTSTGHFCFRV